MELLSSKWNYLTQLISSYFYRQPKHFADYGRISYKGIPYTFSLSKDSWFGSYECRVHKSFLKSNRNRLETLDFEIGGHVWQMHVVVKDGFLAVYVRSRNRSTLVVHYSFTLINYAGQEYETSGTTDVFHSGQTWGFGQFASIASITNREAGFLCQDEFVLKLDLRIKQPENESCSFSTNGKTGIFTWQLRHVCDKSPWLLSSQEFTIGGLDWNLELHPHGQQHDYHNVSVQLRSYNAGAVRARFNLTALNTNCIQDSEAKELKHTFTKIGEGKGWSDFMKRPALIDQKRGFVDDGWLTLTAHVSIEEAIMQDASITTQEQEEPLGEGSECVICLSERQTSGFLHGTTTHKCVCKSCAQFLSRDKELRCPICMEPVERVIMEFF